jgi:MFS family permease
VTAADRAAAPGSTRRDVAVALLATFATQTLASASLMGPTVLAPIAARALGEPPEGIGLFVAVNYLVAMFSGLICAGMVARYGALRVCQFAMLLAGAGLGLGSAGHVGLIIAGAAVLGIGYGWVNPASSHILVDRTPRSMLGVVLSVKQTGVPAGGALAGALIPALTLALGWQASVGLLGAACAALGVVLGLARGRLSDRSRPQSVSGLGFSLRSLTRPLGMVFRSPRLLLLGVTSMVYSALQMNMMTYLVSYLNVTLEHSLVVAGLVFSCSQLAGIVGRIVWGLVADRMHTPIRLMGALGLTSGLCAFAMAAARPDWPVAALVPLCIVFGATAAGWNGIYFALVAQAAPAGEESTVTGGVQFLTFFGALSAPPLFALAVALSGSYALGFSLFGLVTLALGAVLVSWRRLA